MTTEVRMGFKPLSVEMLDEALFRFRKAGVTPTTIRANRAAAQAFVRPDRTFTSSQPCVDDPTDESLIFATPGGNYRFDLTDEPLDGFEIVGVAQ